MKANPINCLQIASKLGKVVSVSHPNEPTKLQDVSVWLQFIEAFNLTGKVYDEGSSVCFHFENGSSLQFNF